MVWVRMAQTRRLWPLVLGTAQVLQGCGRDDGSARVAAHSDRTASLTGGGTEANLVDSGTMTTGSGLHPGPDTGPLHWLGDGYDVLTGDRRNLCLDGDSVTFRSYPVNQVFDTMDVVFSKEELATKLNIPLNVEASGAYDKVTFSPSLKSNILRETDVSGNVLVAVASFIYLRDRHDIYESRPRLDSRRLAELKSDPEDFRAQCGDKFTRSVRTGAALFLVVRAEQVTESGHSLTDIQEAFKIGLGQLFGISQSVQLSYDQKSILSQFRLSTRCYSDGVSPHICADHQLNLTGFNVGDISVFERVGAAKKALATDSSDRKVTAVLEEDLENYPIPAEYKGQGVHQVYFDYKPRLKKIRSWMHLEERVRTICQSLFQDSSHAACAEANESLGAALSACAEQSQWPSDQCLEPRPDEFASITDLANGGWLDLWDHQNQSGRSVRLGLGDLLSRSSPIQANVLYSLHKDRFDFADRVGSVTGHLQNGWQVVLYQHVDGSGSKWVIHTDGPQSFALARWFNNKASSFRVKFGE